MATRIPAPFLAHLLDQVGSLHAMLLDTDFIYASDLDFVADVSSQETDASGYSRVSLPTMASAQVLNVAEPFASLVGSSEAAVSLSFTLETGKSVGALVIYEGTVDSADDATNRIVAVYDQTQGQPDFPYTSDGETLVVKFNAQGILHLKSDA